jgi:hypothetical protein
MQQNMDKNIPNRGNRKILMAFSVFVIKILPLISIILGNLLSLKLFCINSVIIGIMLNKTDGKIGNKTLPLKYSIPI